ncbi:MAG: DUF983 domain-containing protein [Owenweeksia sp.]
MKETCPHCGIRYEIEPAFFYGAMYVSYAYTVAIAVATYIIISWVYDPTVWEILIALVAILLLGSPLLFRLARITWMNLFIKYQPEKRGGNFK